MAKKQEADRIFLLNVIVLTITGFLIFLSASLGLLAKGSAKFTGIAFTQTVFGLVGGIIAFIITSKIDYMVWRKYAFYFFLASIGITLLVFVPGLGLEHGGATRWILVGPLSFQPSELLKLGYLIYVAAWFSGKKTDASTWKEGLIPFIIATAVVALVLLSQPDTDTLIVMVLAGLAIYLAAGANLRDIFLIVIVGLLCFAFLAFTRPYIMARINTFLDPQADSLGSSYQIQQSFIAIGSGGFLGRGFGQSIQKFNFLPEPVGDSIFAVAAEEFGFIGSTILILIFTFFGYRGLIIASRTKETFGRLLALGIVIIIVAQAFINIGAMVGVLPLTGITLPFVSHGGTALLITLAATGIVVNISKKNT